MTRFVLFGYTGTISLSLSLSPPLPLARSKAPKAESAPRRFTLIDESDRRYASVTGHGTATSRLDGVDAERSAQYQSPQNGVVATSLRSTLQRSSYVVDPPARWANRRSVPRRSSPMRIQPDAQLQMYAGNRSRASVHTSFLGARLLDSEFVSSTRSRNESLTVRGCEFAFFATLRFTGSDDSADPERSTEPSTMDRVEADL